jgi:segregation and condensation protein B
MNQISSGAPEQEQIISAIESILFIAGRPVDIADLRKLLEISESATQAAVKIMAERFESEHRGIRIQRAGNQIQLVSAPENARYIAALLGMPTQAKLTSAALETLAVIAYRQPITRAQLESIRGVNCDRAIVTLTQHGLIIEVGRATTVGRPVLFGTTMEFLQQFGLPSLEALPAPDVNDELAERRRRDVRAVRRAVSTSDSTQLELPIADSQETS